MEYYKTKVCIDDTRVAVKLDNVCSGSWFELSGLFYIKMNDMKNDQVECYSFPCNSVVSLNSMAQVYVAKEIKIKPIF